MTTGTTASDDIRIARALAERGAPGSFAYAFFVGLLALMIPFPTTRYAELGLILGIQLVTGVIRKKLGNTMERDYPGQPLRWARSYQVSTMVFAVTWILFIHLVVGAFSIGWELTLCLIVTTGLAAGGISALSPDLKLIIPYLVVMVGGAALVVGFSGSQKSYQLSFMLALYLLYCLAQSRIQNQHYRAESERADLLEQRGQELIVATREAEVANEAKSLFLANMSHEIRTPINGILGMTQLAMSAEDEKERNEYLELADFSGKNLLALVNDILDFSRIEAGQLELKKVETELESLVNDTLNVLVQNNDRVRVPVHWQMAEDLPATLIIDPNRFSQVLNNLVGNAIKFTSQGEISILVSGVEGEEGRWTISGRVQDTGMGIPAGKLGSIFGVFSQADNSFVRRHGGAGLGLAITRSLLRLMGGGLWVESEEGQGSTFHFSFEATASLIVPQEEIVSSIPSGTVPHPDGMSVLVVEDNLVNSHFVTRLLKKKGHRVMVAENGRLGVEAIGNHDFDLVLMDVQMPEMDGLQATREIRHGETNTGGHLPIVALTAHASAEDRERCLAAGMDAYLTKPLKVKKLWKIMEHIDQRASLIC